MELIDAEAAKAKPAVDATLLAPSAPRSDQPEPPNDDDVDGAAPPKPLDHRLYIATVGLLITAIAFGPATRPRLVDDEMAAPPSPPDVNASSTADPYVAGYDPATAVPWWLLPILGMLKKLFTALIFGDVVMSADETATKVSQFKRARREVLKAGFFGLGIVGFIKDVGEIRAALARDAWTGLTQALPAVLATSSNVAATVALQSDIRLRNDLVRKDAGNVGWGGVAAVGSVFVPSSKVDGIFKYDLIGVLRGSLPSAEALADRRVAIGAIHTAYLYFLTAAYAAPLYLLTWYNLLGLLRYLLMLAWYLLWGVAGVVSFGLLGFPPLSWWTIYPIGYLVFVMLLAVYVGKFVSTTFRVDAVKKTADLFGRKATGNDSLAHAWTTEFIALVLYPPVVQLFALMTIHIWWGDPQPAANTIAPRHLASYLDTIATRFATFAEECAPLALVTLADECVAYSAPLVAVLDVVWRIL